MLWYGCTNIINNVICMIIFLGPSWVDLGSYNIHGPQFLFIIFVERKVVSNHSRVSTKYSLVICISP